MQRNFCKHSTDNSGCCLSMSSSPLRRENKSRRDNGTRAILRERSEFHRPTIASSAKRVPREENEDFHSVLRAHRKFRCCASCRWLVCSSSKRSAICSSYVLRRSEL
uniref:Uncharacterized protein n=1 Tax=Parascaris univalens TaxID=6257 RepID=A0A915A3B4_PARUN